MLAHLCANCGVHARTHAHAAAAAPVPISLTPHVFHMRVCHQRLTPSQNIPPHHCHCPPPLSHVLSPRYWQSIGYSTALEPPPMCAPMHRCRWLPLPTLLFCAGIGCPRIRHAACGRLELNLRPQILGDCFCAGWLQHFMPPQVPLLLLLLSTAAIIVARAR